MEGLGMRAHVLIAGIRMRPTLARRGIRPSYFCHRADGVLMVLIRLRMTGVLLSPMNRWWMMRRASGLNDGWMMCRIGKHARNIKPSKVVLLRVHMGVASRLIERFGLVRNRCSPGRLKVREVTIDLGIGTGQGVLRERGRGTVRLMRTPLRTRVKRDNRTHVCTRLVLREVTVRGRRGSLLPLARWIGIVPGRNRGLRWLGEFLGCVVTSNRDTPNRDAGRDAMPMLRTLRMTTVMEYRVWSRHMVNRRRAHCRRLIGRCRHNRLRLSRGQWVSWVVRRDGACKFPSRRQAWKNRVRTRAFRFTGLVRNRRRRRRCVLAGSLPSPEPTTDSRTAPPTLRAARLRGAHTTRHTRRTRSRRFIQGSRCD